MNQSGILIISLDFELNWGVHDVFTLAQYQENLVGTEKAIYKMLALFIEYDIHVTWAIVGLLGFENKQELLRNLPSLHPTYANPNMSPYGKLDTMVKDGHRDPLHFCKGLIEKISKTKGQEIATHTFSHYYCLEKGQNGEQFEVDLKAALQMNRKFGSRTRSIVFPRNQLNEAYLSICQKHGIESYRGNENSWVYKESEFYKEGFVKRAFRLLDHYMNITGQHTYRLQSVKDEPIVNLPSSRFLRPYSAKLKILEGLRMSRIKKGLLHAARNGEVFHLWWHPHNFGKNIAENIDFLKEILHFYSDLNGKYGFKSLTMQEATQVYFSVKQLGGQEDAYNCAKQ